MAPTLELDSRHPPTLSSCMPCLFVLRDRSFPYVDGTTFPLSKSTSLIRHSVTKWNMHSHHARLYAYLCRLSELGTQSKQRPILQASNISAIDPAPALSALVKAFCTAHNCAGGAAVSCMIASRGFFRRSLSSSVIPFTPLLHDLVNHLTDRTQVDGNANASIVRALAVAQCPGQSGYSHGSPVCWNSCK